VEAVTSIKEKVSLAILLRLSPPSGELVQILGSEDERALAGGVEHRGRAAVEAAVLEADVFLSPGLELPIENAAVRFLIATRSGAANSM
jgi:hypothetical protein